MAGPPYDPVARALWTFMLLGPIDFHRLRTLEGVDICVRPLPWTNPYRPPKMGSGDTDSRGPLDLWLPQVGSSMVAPLPPQGPPSFYFIVFKIKFKTLGWG